MKTLAGIFFSICCSIAFGQDVTFYTDTGSNFGDTGFIMPATPNIPGAYSETIAFPYNYALVPGEQPGMSQMTLASVNYTQGRYVVRHYVSHITQVPTLSIVTPVYVFFENLDANGNPTYVVSGTTYNAGDPEQFDPSGNPIDQNGNSVVNPNTTYNPNGVSGNPIFQCGYSYVINQDGTSTNTYQGCMIGYIGNIVDVAHQVYSPQFTNPQPAVNVNGMPIVFSCSSRVATQVPPSYKDRLVDTCVLATQQADGTVTQGALLPSSEYWVTLPFDTACSSLGIAICSTTVPNSAPFSGSAAIYSRTALGAPPAPPTPPCTNCNDD
jgi:hypothetical protein